MLLLRALDCDAAAGIITEGVRYVADLEARVASGEFDAKVAAAEAGRIARSLTQPGLYRDPVCP